VLKNFLTPTLCIAAAVCLLSALVAHVSRQPADSQPAAKVAPTKMSQPLPRRLEGPSAPREATISGQLREVSFHGSPVRPGYVTGEHWVSAERMGLMRPVGPIAAQPAAQQQQFRPFRPIVAAAKFVRHPFRPWKRRCG